MSEVACVAALLAGSWLGAALAIRSFPSAGTGRTPVPATTPGAGTVGLAVLVLFAALPSPSAGAPAAPLRGRSVVLDATDPFEIEASDCTLRSTSDEVKGYATIASIDFGP